MVREDDEFVNGDAGYLGIEKRGEIRESGHLSGVEWRINRRKGRDRKREKELYQKAMEHLLNSRIIIYPTEIKKDKISHYSAFNHTF